ncbi:MAG TPA: hypothetical protein VFV46_04065 [Lacibacter sp.]|nr:hypothetical protein [Lacibacter sp.]
MNYLIIILIIAVAGCRKEQDRSIVLNESFTLKKGETACTPNDEVCIDFVNVSGDSRCPSNVMCIWQGVAEVNLVLKYNQTDYPFTLNTIDHLQYKKDTVLQGYTIQLEQLNPYPDGRPINSRDYVVQLKVRK